MSREAHVQFCEGLAGKFRRSTLLIVTAESQELLVNNIIPAINDFLKPRGLKLSEEKTKIVGIEQGFDFLGQNLKKYRNRLIITPSKENIKSFPDKVKTVIKKCRGRKTADLINQLNPMILGWANYQRYAQSAKAFSHANKIIFQALWRWIKKDIPKKLRMENKEIFQPSETEMGILLYY